MLRHLRQAKTRRINYTYSLTAVSDFFFLVLHNDLYPPGVTQFRLYVQQVFLFPGLDEFDAVGMFRERLMLLHFLELPISETDKPDITMYQKTPHCASFCERFKNGFG